jgi:hypothetical protein
VRPLPYDLLERTDDSSHRSLDGDEFDAQTPQTFLKLAQFGP